MAKYRKEPVDVDAVQWTGRNQNEICGFVNRADLLNYGWNDMYMESGNTAPTAARRWMRRK